MIIDRNIAECDVNLDNQIHLTSLKTLKMVNGNQPFF